mgnify:CR=1 FL=1
MSLAAGPDALRGILVVDLTRVLSGPFATQQLVDLGADVVKVERPGSGDDTRAFGPPFLEGESTYFMSVNRGKRSVALDLKSERGQALAIGLAEQADVVIENFRAGVAERLGLDGARLRAKNTRLVTCSLTGYGGLGDPAYVQRGGYDAVIQATSGLMALTGEPDGAPTKVGVALSDMVAGLYAAQGILTALYARERTGEGAHIDVSMQDAVLSLLSYQAGSYLGTGREPARMGNAHPSICPYETVETADGPFALAVGNDAQFARFVELIGRPELAEDPRFRTNRDRVAHHDALMALLGPALRTRSGAELDRLLAEARIPAGPVLSVGAALEHPQVRARGSLLEHAHPVAGPVRSVGSPVRFVEDGALAPPPSRALEAPPVLGQHTREVLREKLGLADEELDALEAAKVIAGPER